MHTLFEVAFVFDDLPPERFVLEFFPDMLIRIALWGVGRKEFEADAMPVLSDEEAHLFGAMKGGAVDDEDQGAGASFEELFEEVDVNVRVDPALGDVIAQLPLCTDGGEDVEVATQQFQI